MDIITKDTGIIDAVQQHPEILEVFAKYGLGCVGCMAAHYETIVPKHWHISWVFR